MQHKESEFTDLVKKNEFEEAANILGMWHMNSSVRRGLEETLKIWKERINRKEEIDKSELEEMKRDIIEEFQEHRKYIRKLLDSH